MTESTTIQFADGVADVIVLGPVARIEFFIVRPAGQRPREAGSQPDLQREPSFTIAMPVEAFANAVSMLQDVRNKLVEGGVLKVGSEGDPTQRHRQGSSPNFKLDG